MSYGKQAYLQRRISSEASIEKLLFANTWKMLMSRGLIDDADRGASTLRDVARETL